MRPSIVSVLNYVYSILNKHISLASLASHTIYALISPRASHFVVAGLGVLRKYIRDNKNETIYRHNTPLLLNLN
jgi:hypothetical protein